MQPIPQQAQVSRIFDIGLDNETVSPAVQDRVRLMTRQAVTECHNLDVDLLEHLRIQDRDIAQDRFHPPALIIKYRRQTGDVAQGPVIVCQISQTVEVAGQSLLDHAERQDLPIVHARTTGAAIHRCTMGCRHKVQHPTAGTVIAPQGLKTKQKWNHVVPGIQIEFQICNRNMAETNLIMEG